MKTSGVDNGVQSITFNQDCSRLAVGTKTGTRTYCCNPFELLNETHGEDAAIIAMHYNTYLVAHVGAGEAAASSQRCLRLINSRTGKEITRRNYQSAILNVVLNRDRVVVVLEKTIYIYELKSMDHLHTIEEIPSNAAGLVALPGLYVPPETEGAQETVTKSFNFLAYPNNSAEKGVVHVYDVLNLRAGPVIDAHNTRVACLSFNNDGTMLATASTKGTVFRLFSMPTGQRVYEFRRSVATNALIYSMSFDVKSKLFCVSSDKPTIHVFKLDEQETPAADGSWSSYFSSTMQSAATYLPTGVTDLLAQERSFAQINLKHNHKGNPTLCAICGSWPDNVYVLVATSEGILYRYKVNTANGGECVYDVAYPVCDSAEPPTPEMAGPVSGSTQPAPPRDAAAAPTSTPPKHAVSTARDVGVSAELGAGGQSSDPPVPFTTIVTPTVVVVNRAASPATPPPGEEANTLPEHMTGLGLDGEGVVDDADDDDSEHTD